MLYRSKLSEHVDCVSYQGFCHAEAPCRQALCGSLRESSDVMATMRDKLREDVQFRVLRLLQENPELSQRDLARAVGVSTGGMHYIINALVEKGLLKLGNFTSAFDKRRYAYKLTPKGLSEKARLTRKFLIRKMAEYEVLKAEIEDVRGDLSEPELAAIRSELKGHPYYP